MSTHADVEIELEAEPSLEIEPDTAPAAELEIEPDETTGQPLAPVALMQVLPADFPLPALIRFVPDVRLKAAADTATAYLLSLDVTGAEGLQRADRALTAERETRKAIEAHFADPADIANKLHKRLTGLRGEWCEPGENANKVVGRRVWAEQQRLEAIAAEERRRAQAEADRQARETAQREAAAAEQAKAPEPVVQELKRQAETATAAPVPTPAPVPAMRGTSAVTTWKARLVGTPADAEPNPKVADLALSQRAKLFDLLRAIIDGKAPITAIEFNWSVLNGRAKSDKSTLAIAGIEAFADGGIRAKGRRT